MHSHTHTQHKHTHTIVVDFLLACPKRQLNSYRQHKMQQLELIYVGKLTTSHLFSDNFIGCPFMTAFTISSFCHASVSSWICSSLPLRAPSFLHPLSPSDWLQDLDVSRPRVSKTKRYGHRTFRYVAPSLWNTVPGGIRESDSTQSFKVSLKTHFFNCNWKPSQSWCWWCQCLHWWWYWWCVCVSVCLCVFL